MTSFFLSTIFCSRRIATATSTNFFSAYFLALGAAGCPPRDTRARTGPAVRIVCRARSSAAAVDDDACAMLAWLWARAESTPGSCEGGGRLMGGWPLCREASGWEDGGPGF